MRKSTVVAVAFLSMLALGGIARAGTTGKLTGVVVDASGDALPGVTITVTSPSLIGSRVTVTSADGTFTFPALTPGSYEVNATLDGFTPVVQTAVPVRLDGTTDLRVELQPGTISDQIVVTSEAPVVDPEEVGTSQLFTQDYLDNAVIGSGNRSYQSVLAQSGGVTGGSNPNVYGSTQGENVFLIDGIDTTDPVTSTFGTNFNFDAIQEISFKTGGFEAEYGRATGGVVNVITKSGGNDFSGTFDVRYIGDSFTESGDHFDKDAEENERIIPGFTLGGPISRDRVWFFLADEYTKSDRKPVGAPVTRTFEANYLLAKVTGQFNPSWQAVVKYSTDPADIDNANVSLFRTPEAHTFQEQGGDIFQGELSGVLTSSLLWDLKGAVQQQELNAFPQTGDFNAIGHLDDATGLRRGSPGNAQFSERDRSELKTSLTYFMEAAGSHEIKGGLEYADLEFTSRNYTPSGFFFRDRLLSGVSRPRLLYVSDPNPPDSVSTGGLQTAYVQDSWNVTSAIVASIGVRYDQVAFDNNEGTEVADMAKLQPRLGLAWDITNDGKTLARAAWGRFMHPSALTLPNFARTSDLPTDVYISCTRFAAAFGSSPAACMEDFGSDWLADPEGGWDANGWFYLQTLSSEPSTIDPDLDPTYADELIVSFERQIFDRTSLTLTYVDKETKDLFEDTCIENFPTPDPNAECHSYFMANLGDDVLTRDYEGLILTFESRATNWMTLLASYTYSKSRGSVEYTQNAGVDFDLFPDHYANTYGYLSDDRRHRVKLNGFFRLPLDFVVGFDAFWSSKFAYDFLEAAPVYGDSFVEPRGSRRANDNYQLDVEVKKGFQFGKIRTEVIATIFNLLDDERPTGVCERETCGGGLELGDATTYQLPRSYEIGLRLEF